MPYLEGSTVRQKVKQRPLKLDEALDIAIQAGEGLRAAHAKGIVHRDIKGANLMVSPQGQVKVMDFGLAQAADQSLLTKTETLLGTPVYMSPEQAQRLPTDRRTDIWSLGIVIYEMLIGRTPFEAEREQAVLYAIAQEEPEPITSQRARVPLDLDWVVSKALAKDKEERYPHIDDMLVDLRAVARQVEESSGTARPSKRPTTKVQREAPARARRRRLTWALGIAAAAVVLTIAGLGVRNFLPTTEAPPEPMEVVPFTTTEGDEMWPSFSPDGNQIAFAWGGPRGENWDIYVKLIGPSPPLRLTTDPRREVLPVFSPDGREILFGRALETGEAAALVMPSLGGPERQLAEVPIDGGGGDWSPDGQYILVSDRESDDSPLALFAVSRETGEKRRLTNPPEQSFGDANPAFSPDGRTLAFVRMSVGTVTGYLLDLDENLEPQGKPRQLIAGLWNPRSLTWTVDGTEIIFDSGQSGVASRLMRIAVEGGQPPRPLASTGENARMPTISPQGNRLAFVRTTAAQANIWRVGVASPGGQAGAPTKLISSSRLDIVPRYSPDGEQIAFASTRSGDYQIWVSDADGANARQLTYRFSVAATPHWSPEGEQIVFHGQTERGKDFDIYTMSARGGGVPRRLTTDRSLDFVPTWSRDGRWIYFVSARGGGEKRTPWKIPAEGGEATQISGNEALNVRESLDGEFLYYFRHDAFPKGAIWRVSTSGGEENLVVSGVGGRAFEVVDEGIYFIAEAGADGLHSIHFFDLATEETTVVLAGVERPAVGLTVSPDGESILFARNDAFNNDIMLVENFR